MKMKCEVEFLGSGEVTWETPNGKSSARRRIEKGTRMILMAERHFTGNWELWDGESSIIVPPEMVRVVLFEMGDASRKIQKAKALKDAMLKAITDFKDFVWTEDFVATVKSLPKPPPSEDPNAEPSDVEQVVNVYEEVYDVGRDLARFSDDCGG